MAQTPLEKKIANGHPLSPSEQAFVMRSCDGNGTVSRRKFTGLAEYPQSEIDVEETIVNYGNNEEYSG